MFICHANIPADTSSISENNSTHTYWMSKLYKESKSWDWKGNSGVVEVEETRPQHGPQTRGVHQHLLWTLPKCYITKWNQTPIRMLIINIQSINSKPDALLHHITLNDIDACFITETWINTDHDLQLLKINISGLGYKMINKHRENQ